MPSAHRVSSSSGYVAGVPPPYIHTYIKSSEKLGMNSASLQGSIGHPRQQRQGWLVLAHGVKGKRWDGDRDL
jgi:hypothetical protein